MRKTATVGLVAVVFGLTVVLRNGLASTFGSMSYTFVTMVGIIALVQGLRYGNDARHVDARGTETADVEDRYEVPSPGGEVDELLADVGGQSLVSIKQRRELHSRLRDVARETLRARGEYDESEIADALKNGTWTADPVAAWFLGEDLPSPRTVRIRGILGSDVEFTFAVERTVAALAMARTADEPVERVRPAGERGLVQTVRAVCWRELHAVRNRLPGPNR